MTCDSPGKVPMGNLLGKDQFGAGDIAEFECFFGHNLLKVGEMECGLSGKWMGDLPHCIPRLCTGPGYLDKGTLLIGTWTHEPISEAAVELLRKSIDEKRNSSKPANLEFYGSDALIEPDFSVFYPVGSELIMECLSGYKLSGENVNVCMDEDSWKNPFPICEEIVCPSIGNIDNGKITIEGFKFGQNLFYECDVGYSLVGTFLRTCMENGSWSGKEPFCSPRICPEPQEVENGRLEPITSLEYGSIATYTCIDGFQILGGFERVCGHLGTWSGQPPLCVNTSQTCLVPQLINSGYVAFDGNLEVGSQAWYDCNNEFNLIGPKERTCLSNGKWTGEEPMCAPRNCQAVQSILHGTVIGLEFSLESSLQFSCDQGYKLVGEESITCTSEGNWSNPPPVCIPILCLKPTVVSNGIVRGSARRYADSISYECLSGYTLLGPKIRRCESDGVWSGTEPFCASITCPELPELPNGKTELELRIPGEKVRFRCDLGWTLHGSTNITCNGDGDWEGAIPSCEPTSCLLLESQTNATLLSPRQDSYEMGSKVLFTCPEGLKLVGSNQMVCLPTGDWDIDPPSCLKPDCGSIIELNHGIIFGLKNVSAGGMEVNFSCDNGYHKIGHSHMQCTLDGDWTGRLPICSKNVCPEMPTIESGHFEIVRKENSYSYQFKCQDNYEIEGAESITCLEDNQWSAQVPRCKLAFCPKIKNIPMMIYKKKGIRLGETVHFSCASGFELIGDAFIKCLHSGVWEKEFPQCKPKICQVKRNIRHGSWKIIPSSFKKEIWALGQPSHLDYELTNSATVTVGDSIEISCDPGYEVYGSKVIKCLTSAVLDSPMTKCRESYCPQLNIIEDGYIANQATYKGAIVTYRCNPGFRINGDATRKCRRNKSWSNRAPVCRIVNCPEPHNIAHGEVEYDRSDLAYRSQIQYSCHLGYEMVGVNIRTCGADGQWEGSEPECTQIRCSVPMIPLHGEQEIQDLTVGGTVTYNCNHGYKVNGNRIITCFGNKTWSSSVPKCDRIFCKKPMDITNGKVIFRSNEYKANIEYQCDTGYNLVGRHTHSCLHTGLWSGQVPSCIENFCPVIEISHGKVHMPGRIPGIF